MHAADRMRQHAPVDNFVDSVVCLWISVCISLRKHLRKPEKKSRKFFTKKNKKFPKCPILLLTMSDPSARIGMYQLKQVNR